MVQLTLPIIVKYIFRYHLYIEGHLYRHNNLYLVQELNIDYLLYYKRYNTLIHIHSRTLKFNKTTVNLLSHAEKSE